MNRKVRASYMLGILSFFWAGSAQAISLDLIPISQSVNLGQTAQVAIAISELGEDTLGTFDLTLAFNPNIIAFKSASFGDPLLGSQLDWNGKGVVSLAIPDLETVELYEVSLAGLDDIPTIIANQPNSFILATLSFNTLKSGTSLLSLANVILGDANGDPLTASLSDGSITVNSQTGTSIPESSSPWGILVSSLGLLGLNKVKRQMKYEV